MNQDYQAGKNGQPFLGGDYNQWEQGKHDGGHNSGGGGIGCLFLLLIPVMLILILPVISSLIAAIGIAGVLSFIFKSKSEGISYKNLYWASFWTSFCYNAIFIILFVALVYLDTKEIDYINLFKYLLKASLFMQIPCIIVSSLVLKYRIKSNTNMIISFMISMLYCLCIVFPITVVSDWMVYTIAKILFPSLFDPGF